MGVAPSITRRGGSATGRRRPSVGRHCRRGDGRRLRLASKGTEPVRTIRCARSAERRAKVSSAIKGRIQLCSTQEELGDTGGAMDKSSKKGIFVTRLLQILQTLKIWTTQVL